MMSQLETRSIVRYDFGHLPYHILCFLRATVTSMVQRTKAVSSHLLMLSVYIALASAVPVFRVSKCRTSITEISIHIEIHGYE